MKIAVIIPVWKRPKVLRVALENWKNPPNKLKIDLFFCFIVSKNDPKYDENLSICSDFLNNNNHNGIVVEYKNEPLGEKMNAGLRILLGLEWDYLMNFGSDDVLSDDYWGNFFPYIFNSDDYVAMDTVIFVDASKTYAIMASYPITGAGRLIKRSLIENTFNELGFVYNDKMNSGMDTASRNNLLRANEFNIIRVNGCFVADIKTLTNINIFDEIKDKADGYTEINAEQFKRFGDLSAICSKIAND